MTGLQEKLPKTKTEKLLLALIAVVLVAIAALLLAHPRTKDTPVEYGAADSVAAELGEPKVIYRDVEKLVEVEKAVTVKELEGGMKEMGVLITEEYYFTDLMSFSSVKKFLKTDYVLPFTESSYLVSYDGVVSAGVDLAFAWVQKDDIDLKITVHLPEAAIQSTDIDLDSFRLHEEKTGLGNPLSVQDFNSSLRELELSAEQKAIERGLLDKANENAQTVLSRFIGSLVDLSRYSLEFVTF